MPKLGKSLGEGEEGKGFHGGAVCTTKLFPKIFVILLLKQVLS